MVSEKNNKLPVQQKKLVAKKPLEEVKSETVTNTDIGVVNSNTDNHKTNFKFLYKILVSNGDYVNLQEIVAEHLNSGWTLVGGVSLAVHADSYSKTTIFSQAIQKTI